MITFSIKMKRKHMRMFNQAFSDVSFAFETKEQSKQWIVMEESFPKKRKTVTICWLSTAIVLLLLLRLKNQWKFKFILNTLYFQKVTSLINFNLKNFVEDKKFGNNDTVKFAVMGYFMELKGFRSYWHKRRLFEK